MPPPGEKNLNRKALRWPKAGTDDANEPTFSAPEVVECDFKLAVREGRAGYGGRAVDATLRTIDPLTTGDRIWVLPLDADQDAWDDPLAYFTGSGSGGDETDLLEVIRTSEVAGADGRWATRRADLVWVGGGDS